MMRSSAPSSLLIINLGGIGDLLLSTGAVSAIRVALPQVRLDLLTIERCSAFMRTYHLFDTVYAVPDTRSLPAVLRTLMTLRRNRYDVAVNMRTITGRTAGLKLRALLTMIGARSTAGRNTDGYGSFLDERIPETLIAAQPEYLFDADTVRALGIPVDDPAPVPVPISAEDRSAARILLASAGITSDDTVIGVHPGGEPSRRWPSERFVELLRRLRAQRSCTCIVTGSMNEHQVCAGIAAAAGAVHMAGKTATVGTMAAILERCRLFIANDTGAMHVCVSVGTPGVFLFGPGQIGRYRPFREPGKHMLVQSTVPCAPCDHAICRDLACMRAIAVDDVYDAATRSLEGGDQSC